MDYQNVFERYEYKYFLTPSQKRKLLEETGGRLELDKYGRTTIRNIYYDTDSFRLIRDSLEHPVYKDKLRLRSYQRADSSDPVFVEIKKKFDGIVYKRRITMNAEEAAFSLADNLFEGEILEAAAGQELVQVIDIPLQVFAVVEFEGARTDHGIQRFGRVRELDEGEHGISG